MTASLLQLVCVGSEDYYLIGNPQITYFKSVFKKHTPFSIERLQQFNDGSRKINYEDKTELIYKINPQYSDFLGSIYFNIKLPEIYSTYPYKFLWIHELGSLIVEEAYLYINDKLIETLDSNLIKLLNVKYLNKKNKTIYDTMTCNTSVYNTDINYKFTHNKNSYPDLINSEYTQNPSIPEANIYIKLPFFFSRGKYPLLPLLKLRKSSIIIKIILRPLKQLYILGNKVNFILGKFGEEFNHLKQESYNTLGYYKYFTNYTENYPNIYDFVEVSNVFDNLEMSLFSYNYFCTNREMNYILKNEMNFIVNIIKKNEKIGQLNYSNIKIKNNELIQEITLIPYRSDQKIRNSWNNNSSGDELNDYKYINKYLNNYLNISFDQYISDIKFIDQINNSYQEILNTLSNYGIITIEIKYYQENQIIVEKYDGKILDINKPWEEYIKCLTTVSDHKIDKFTYYGKFINFNNDLNDITIYPEQFRLKLLNNNLNFFSTNENLWYLPNVIVNNTNSEIVIDFTNPIYTESILTIPIIVPNNKLIQLKEFREYLTIWPFRTQQQIPNINNQNKTYFTDNHIIENFKLNMDGKDMIDIDKSDLYYINKFKYNQHYYNQHLVNYSFSYNPNKEKPSGHVNFGSFIDVVIYLKNQDIIFNEKNNNMNYNFNFNIYLHTINHFNLKNDILTLENSL